MTTQTTPTLRIAVLADGDHVQRWQRNALAALDAEPGVEISTVVVNERQTDVDDDHGPLTFLRGAADRFRTYPLWSLVGVGRLLTPDLHGGQPVPLASVGDLSEAEWVACTPQSVDEYWNTLPDHAVASLSDVDVAVRFGFGMLKGEALSAPTHGVLSYHLGDIREYRGQPGGFWEFLHGDDEMGVTVQRLTETLDGGEIAALERVDIGDTDTFREVRAAAYRTAETMLVPAVRTLTDDERSVDRPDRIGTLYTMPEGRDVLRYALKDTQGYIATVDVPVSRATGPRAVALLTAGAAITGVRTVLSDESGDGLHTEQLVGLLLVAVSLALLLDDGDSPPRRWRSV